MGTLRRVPTFQWHPGLATFAKGARNEVLDWSPTGNVVRGSPQACLYSDMIERCNVALLHCCALGPLLRKDYQDRRVSMLHAADMQAAEFVSLNSRYSGASPFFANLAERS